MPPNRPHAFPPPLARLAAALLFVCLLAPALQAGAPPEGAVPFAGSRWMLYPGRVDWHVARDKCRELGGRLAVVPSAEVNRFLAELADGRSVWIGANDEEAQGEWRWADGPDVEYANWAPGRPERRSARPSRNRYVRLEPDGTWRETHCGGADFAEARAGKGATGFVCEWPDEPFERTAPPQPRPLASPPPEAERHRDRWYAVFLEPVAWHVARQRAEGMGGRLAAPRNAAENAFLSRLAGRNRVWLGGTDAAQEGRWVWSHGARIAYFNWRRGEPNNYLNHEHYLHMNSDGSWNDTNCGGFWDAQESVAGYIVEWGAFGEEGQTRPCAQCGNDLPQDYRYCPYCGVPLRADPPQPDPPTEGRRRRVPGIEQ